MPIERNEKSMPEAIVTVFTTVKNNYFNDNEFKKLLCSKQYRLPIAIVLYAN